MLSGTNEAVRTFSKALRQPPNGMSTSISFIIFLLTNTINGCDWDVIIRKVIIPRLLILQHHKVPPSFVDGLLWVPSGTEEHIYLRLSDLKSSDQSLGSYKMK